MPDPSIVIAALCELTPREAEAVLWVAQGKTSWEAGRILGVAESTVNAHVAHAAEKLNAVNRAHLVARAFVRGILAVGTQRAISLFLVLVCTFGVVDNARRPPRAPRCRRRDDVECVIASTPGAL
ncbi:MAG TPA: helix-turn-helix transcriptional regulator [Pseudoxanthomonas sp.]